MKIRKTDNRTGHSDLIKPKQLLKDLFKVFANHDIVYEHYHGLMNTGRTGTDNFTYRRVS